MQDDTALQGNERTVFGHPYGLVTIFFTEMWERFGYYGMRALLILYMTKAFLFSDDKAYGIYGAFTAFVYITPIVGGILADRLLGFRQASILGCIIMALGYFMLAVPSDLMATYQPLFYCALALIAIGNGLFKPNTSSLVGTLYGPNDNRRDAGYTIFYMGINTGSILAPVLCGYVGEVYGWSYGFALTGIGLILGLFTFIRGQDTLQNQGLPPHPEKLAEKSRFGISNYNQVLIGIVLLTPVIAYVLTGSLTGMILNITGIVTVLYILFTVSQSSADERNKIYALLIMMFFYTSFFACFEQAGSSINLFTDRNVDRTLALHLGFINFDWTVPTTFFQAVNPLIIVTVAPVVAYIWTWLAKFNKEPSTPVKFIIGLLLASLGFLTLVFGAQFADDNGMTGMFWLFLGYFFLTVGELAISPVGLAMVSKLAPKKILGLIMGALLLSVAFGNYLASVLAKLASAAPVEGGSSAVTAVETLPIYTHAFTQVATFAAGFAVILLVLTPVVKRLMGDNKAAIADEDTLTTATAGAKK